VEERIDGALRVNQPAGHLERGESLVEAAARECLEETGWVFQPESLIGVFQLEPQSVEAPAFVRFAFAGSLVRERHATPPDSKILRARWMSWDDINAARGIMRSPLVMATIERYRAGDSLPLEYLHQHRATADIIRS
jgi:8-oxo-dGTP pyrophosphatase MutT (NUDIX family)